MAPAARSSAICFCEVAQKLPWTSALSRNSPASSILWNAARSTK